jgi:hypothetical protein
MMMMLMMMEMTTMMIMIRYAKDGTVGAAGSADAGSATMQRDE